MADAWISDETEGKEVDFRGILNMHMSIAKAIIARQSGPPYLYIDLYAGPGRLAFRGKEFDGSPLIFTDTARRLGLETVSAFYEQDTSVADRLKSALAATGSAGHFEVHAERCEAGFPRLLERMGARQGGRYGLIYSDPICDEIPHALLNAAAQRLPRVDLLSYVSATQYKRRRGVDENRPFLADHIAAVDKKVALIRIPTARNQWTFVLWSNWVDLPEWKRRGFYRLDSERGQQIMEQLNLSAREQLEAANTPLPFDDPPYASYREYLRHPRFLAIRAKVFARAGGVCERCKSRPPTEPHHLRYPPWGTFDVPENMIAVCHPCHCEIHGKAT